ncbi:dihydrolipoyl dehydrogenase [Candidatus Woesearchaeota archaeon]|nr:dihydrolipoyl dehydrogenase [Candidatus Woesearchaeota archaeon]
MKEFDLIVIGAGSGLDVAYNASSKGLKVAIIEKGEMGGTCLNRGCIPSKMLIHRADILKEIKRAKLFGIDAKINSIDFKSMIKNVSKIIDGDSKNIENSYKNLKNPVLYKGEAKFIGFKTIKIDNEIIKAEKVLIAVGARPSIPDTKGLSKVNYITSTEALRLNKQPKVMTVLGGGYIAAELAHFYGELGTKINIVQRSKIMLKREDSEIAEKFTELFKKKYDVYTEFDIEEVYKKNNDFYVRIKKGKLTKILKSDQLLVVTGITPNNDLLDLNKTEVKVNSFGYIPVNEFMETNVKGIYALGDCVGNFFFKHSANLEAEYVLRNVLDGNKHKVDYYAMPHAIFTDPQIAGVGYTEDELNEKKINYLVGKYNYYDTGMGMAIEDKDGFVKLLVEKSTRKILGCHILGTDASTLIHEVIVAMKTGDGTVDNLINSVHIHPALSEVVQRAAFEI